MESPDVWFGAAIAFLILSMDKACGREHSARMLLMGPVGFPCFGLVAVMVAP
jgi:hypothetical protein